METLKIDKAQLTKEFSAESCLEDIIRRLEKIMSLNGRMICGLKVNGLSLSEKDELRLRHTAIVDIDLIEVHLEEQSALLQNSLNSFTNYCKDLKVTVVEQADILRMGRSNNFHQQFSRLVEDIQLLSEGLMALKPNLFSGKEEDILFAAWQAAEECMFHSVQELNDAYKNQDFVRVCDVLEYELSTSFDNWLKLLPLL